MSEQPQEQRQPLTPWQRGVVVTIFLCTLGLSIFDRPTLAFALVGIGTLLLLLIGSDITRIVFRIPGGETIIERAKDAERGALKAALEAKEAVARAEKAVEALKEMGVQLTSTVLPLALELEPREVVREVFSSAEKTIKQRNYIKRQLIDMGCSDGQINRALEDFDFLAVKDIIRETARHLEFGLYESELDNFLRKGHYDPDGLLRHVMEYSEKPDYSRHAGTDRLEGLADWIREVTRLPSSGTVDFAKFRRLPGAQNLSLSSSDKSR